jgi:hypothetical protein
LIGRTSAIVAANAAVIAAVLFATIAVPTGPLVAVVVAPWSEPEAALSVVAAAEGSIVAPGRVGWMVIAHGEDRSFASRLRRNGAWLVLNHALLAGCLGKQ